MAINFPTSLDNFTNPVSGNTLDSPSHSLQHSDLNDAVEALERKVGVGTAVAGSASAGQVLTISAAGTSTWSTPTPAGLVLLSTTSFTSVGSQAIPVGSFSATYDFYRVICDFTAATADAVIFVKMRASGTDSSGGYYSSVGFINVSGTFGSSAINNGSNGFQISEVDSATAGNHTSGFVLDLQRPFIATYTTMQVIANAATSAGTIYSNFGGGVHAVGAAYDQINVIASAGSISGKIQVYGYNQ